VEHIIACGNERPVAFWAAAMREAVELDRLCPRGLADSDG
jgi:hypothetical protein